MKKMVIGDLAFVIFNSIWLVVVYNFGTIKSQFLTVYSLESNFYQLASFLSQILATLVILILFFLVLSFISKLLLRLFLIISLLISSIYLYIFNKFGIIFDESMLANALVSIGHICEVIDYWLVLYLLVLALVPILLITRIELVRSSFKKKLWIFLFSLLVLITLHFSFLPTKLVKLASINYSPINYTKSFYNYQTRIRQQLNQKRDRVSLSKLYHFDYHKRFDNLNVILVIGESLRSDHLGLNHYVRNTTPNLAKVQNLLNFEVAASFNITAPSVTSMLSHRTKADFVDIPAEKSVISVFKDLGFKTYWYSNQSSKEFINGMLTIMASEADDYFFRDRLKPGLDSEITYDEALLPFVKKVLDSGGSNFIVLHSFGSHIRFHERYPRNFAVFKPECFATASSCQQDEVVNSYDNSVLYTDHFISELIKLLGNTNSILFFVADHGSFLGEGGVYANGNSNQVDSSVHLVPMFFYASEVVLKDKTYKNKFIRAAKKTKSHNLSHDNLFDSLLDCSGIDSSLLDRNLSICR